MKRSIKGITNVKYAIKANIWYEVFLFSVAGFLGFLVNASIVWILTAFMKVNAIIAQIPAFSLAVTTTWLFNRNITFFHYSRTKNLFQEWLNYVTANFLGAFINNGVYVLLVLNITIMGKKPVLAVVCGSLAGLIFNFVASRTLVFRTHK
jgi:putative flippase GtrA